MTRILILGFAATLLATACGTTSHSYREDRYARPYYVPPSAHVQHYPVGDKQLVCHKGKNTLDLPPSAVQAHLDHGDRRGRC
jgi:hypothetical protein